MPVQRWSLQPEETVLGRHGLVSYTYQSGTAPFRASWILGSATLCRVLHRILHLIISVHIKCPNDYSVIEAFVQGTHDWLGSFF